MPDFIALLGESLAIATKLGYIEYCDDICPVIPCVKNVFTICECEHNSLMYGCKM